MYHYTIPEAFELNWKYVAPKNFTELEIFITPKLSVGIDGISNGKHKFSIGAYLTESNNKVLFENEYLIKKSTDRVNKAFNVDAVSVFFTPDEAKELDELFKEEQFTVNYVNVYKNGRKVDLFSLSESDFSKVMELFEELKVQQSVSIKSKKDTFEDLRSDMYKAALKKIKEDHYKRQKESNGVSRKKIKLQAIIGALITTGAITLGVIGDKAVKAKGMKLVVAGSLCKMISMVMGVAGGTLLKGATDYYAQGVIVE